MTPQRFVVDPPIVTLNPMIFTNDRHAGFWSGAFAALVATVVGYVAYQGAGWFFWPEVFAQWVFALVPGPIQAELIGWFGFDAKILGFYTAILVQIAAGGLIGLMWRQASGLVLGAVVAGVLAVTTAAFDLSFSAVQLSGVLHVAAGGLLTCLLFGLLAPPLRGFLTPQALDAAQETPTQIEWVDPRHPRTRRRLLVQLGTIAGAAALWPWVRADLRPATADSVASSAASAEAARVTSSGGIDFDAISDLSPWLTPEEEFYYVSKNLTVYQTDATTWAPLTVEGLVDSPLELNLDDVKQLPSMEQHATLMCIDYKADKPATRDLMSNGRWTGTSLKGLLEQAGVQAAAKDLKFQAADGYSDSLPVDLVMEHEDIMLAWALNGEELSPKHGYPLRLIIPGYYGVKNVKHIRTIVATEEDYQGYWQNRGWSDECDVYPLAKIETPGLHAQVTTGRPHYIAGVAFAGLLGVSAVEVSTDGGETWHEAEVEAQPNARYSWRRWAHVWEPVESGQHTLLARMIDGQGKIQTADSSAAYPDGSTGYDEVWVDAVSAS